MLCMKNILIVLTLLLSGCATGPTLCQSRLNELDQAKSEGKITETDYLKLKLDLDKMCIDKPRTRIGAALKAAGDSMNNNNRREFTVYNNSGQEIGTVR